MKPERPVDETRQDRLRQTLVALGVAYMLLMSTAAAAFGIIDYRSQTNHHASTAVQQAKIVSQGNTIIRQQGDNHALGKANHTLSLKIQADAERLANEGQTIAAEFGLICVTLHISSPLCTTGAP